MSLSHLLPQVSLTGVSFPGQVSTQHKRLTFLNNFFLVNLAIVELVKVNISVLILVLLDVPVCFDIVGKCNELFI